MHENNLKTLHDFMINEATGKEAYYVDLDAHNGNIFDKIVEEIRNCKFLVTDFTCQNSGVYYETCYSKGIGKTVIYIRFD